MIDASSRANTGLNPSPKRSLPSHNSDLCLCQSSFSLYLPGVISMNQLDPHISFQTWARNHRREGCSRTRYRRGNKEERG